jgi:hypothetical protein
VRQPPRTARPWPSTRPSIWPPDDCYWPNATARAAPALRWAGLARPEIIASVPIRAEDDFGETWDDPSGPELLGLLEGITDSGGWLVIERVDDPVPGLPDPQWMQVLSEEDGIWAVDYRSGTEQIQARVTELRIAFDVLSDWIDHGPNWRKALSWQQIR